MALIAPNICRYTIEGTLAGQDCMNIVDVRIIGGITTSRTDIIPDIGGDILNNWDDHLLPLLVDDYTALRVRWVDLDSADGVTGSVSSTDGATWPKAGAETQSALPNNTYAKLVKVLESKERRNRNGIMRLGGIHEGQTEGGAPNTLSVETRNGINARMEDFKDGINGATSGEGSSQNIVVVHTVDREYVGYSEVARYSCAPVVGTLRRRMPGYGS